MKLEIVWNGSIVGYIQDGNFDHLHLYGKWIAVDSATTHEFLKRLRNEEELTVQVGSDPQSSLVYRIDHEPSAEIEMTMRLPR